MSIFSELGLRDGKDRFREEFLYNLAFCYQLSQKRIEDFLIPFGLSAVKFNALLIVKHIGQEKGITQSELAKKMIVTAGNITRLVDRMQDDKHIERLPDPHDRRINRIRITKASSKLLENVWPKYLKELESITHALKKNHIQNGTHILDVFRKGLGL